MSVATKAARRIGVTRTTTRKTTANPRGRSAAAGVATGQGFRARSKKPALPLNTGHKFSWPFGLVMIEAMPCGTLVIAFNRGSVREVVDDGLTGFIVEDEEGAIGAFDRLSQLSREKIRRHFEQRFTARRMALEYLAAYRSLMDREVQRLKLVVDGAPAI